MASSATHIRSDLIPSVDGRARFPSRAVFGTTCRLPPSSHPPLSHYIPIRCVLSFFFFFFSVIGPWCDDAAH